MVIAVKSVSKGSKKVDSDVSDKEKRLEGRLNNLSLEAEEYIPISRSPVYIPLLDRLKKKYEVYFSAETPEQVSEQVSEQILGFDEDSAKNHQILCMICSKVRELKEKYKEILDDNEKIYLRTADNFISRLERFIAKGNYKPNKVADELKRTVSLTILKNFANRKLAQILDEFFAECGFVKIELPVGKSVEDDDFDYIGDNYLKADVDSPDKHNIIIEKKHDAYIFNCYDSDDEEFFREIIPGDYTIGCWRE